MYLSKWMKKWLTAVSICLLIILGCGTYLFFNSYESKDELNTKYVINQVRLKVSNIMLYVEKNHKDIYNDRNIHNTLLSMCKENNVSLLVVQLDGNVIFTSSKTSLNTKIDLKNSLHYDLYTSKLEKDVYKIAFPVVDDETKLQIGNAIFTMPESSLLSEKSPSTSLYLFIIMTSFLIILFMLLYLLRNKMKHFIIEPIKKLKYFSESILKGDYEQKAEYGEMNEIGEVYAMFDQMRLEIIHLNARRDEQEKAQKELITNISHDLKTPLTTVMTYIEAIRAGVCPNMETVMAYSEVMQTNAAKMARLVDDLLMHALKELGQISINRTEQYSRSVFETILKPIGHYVRTTGVTFREPTEIPNVLINVDAPRMEQVISNLITNALKHASSGDEISISIDQEKEQLKITISDTGEGILPQDMPFIFERYFKGQPHSKHEKNKNKGTGLGLSICKYIIEAHDGIISFKSVKDQGTVFYFTIPLI